MIIKNFITTLKRFTASSVLNVIGLAVAFATAYLILVQVRHDFTYNKSVPDGERVFYLERSGAIVSGAGDYIYALSRPLGNSICKDNPAVEDFGLMPTMDNNTMEFCQTPILVRNVESDSYQMYNSNVVRYSVTYNAAELLGARLVKGEFSKADDAYVITESAAKRMGLDVGDAFCFGDEWGKSQCSITALVTDFPQNSDWEKWSCLRMSVTIVLTIIANGVFIFLSNYIPWMMCSSLWKLQR